MTPCIDAVLQVAMHRTQMHNNRRRKKASVLTNSTLPCAQSSLPGILHNAENMLHELHNIVLGGWLPPALQQTAP